MWLCATIDLSRAYEPDSDEADDSDDEADDSDDDSDDDSYPDSETHAFCEVRNFWGDASRCYYLLESKLLRDLV